MIYKNRKIIITGLLVFITMVMIFAFSSQNAGNSDGLSKEITRRLLRFYYYLTENMPLFFEDDLNELGTSSFFEDMNHYVRKAAHMLEFAFLGSTILIHIFFVWKEKAKVFSFIAGIEALFISFLYACSDEFHQLFVPERGAQFKDVLIDSTGAFIGILFFFLIIKLHIRRRIVNGK